MKNQEIFYWSSNIRFLRNRKKLSQEELSGLLNISRGKLNAHEQGRTQNPGVEDLIGFSDFFKISIDNLVKVDLSALSELKLRELEAGNDIYATGTKLRVLATTVDADNNENVELVPVKAKAGYTLGYGDPEYISKLPVFHLPHLPKDRKYRMFPTSGDSMLPVPENAFVIGEFVEDWLSLKAQSPCIVVTKDDGIVFKLVSNDREKNSLQLASLNTVYKPYEVPCSQVLEVWVFKNYLTDTLPEGEMSMDQMARALQEIRDDVKRLIKTK